MLFQCNERIGINRFNDMSEESLRRCNEFVKSYDVNLFCKWNYELQQIEIWEHGKNGNDFMVIWIDNRMPDYRDLEDIDSRSTFKRSQRHFNIELEADRHNKQFKEYMRRKQKQKNYDISVDVFDNVFQNPVITGG